MTKKLLSKWPYFSGDEITAASNVLQSGNVNYWTGSETKNFEKEFSRYTLSPFSLAVANGSLALSASYLAAGLKPGDEVITTPRTFIATASSLVLLQVIPIFADVDRDSGCINAKTIEPLITSKTKAISVVHVSGWPADMDSICDLASSRGLTVIEDCAQAHGAAIFSDNQWRSVGSFGHLAAWSFCQDKILTTGGEGGMVTTSDPSYWQIMWSLKEHGKSYQAVTEASHVHGFRWLHHRFGSNFRMTEMQSAIGRVQLTKLNRWNYKRAANVNIIVEALSGCSLLRLPVPSTKYRHGWYKFHAYLNHDALCSGWSRDRILSEISSLGYPGLSGSCSEIYLEKCFRDAGLSPQHRLPVARELGESSILFLVHPTITIDQMELYVSAVHSVLKRALK